MADLQLYIGIILTLGICIVLVTALFYYSRQRFAILEHSHKEQAMILHEFITTTSRDVDGMKHMLMNVSFPYFQNQQSHQSQQSQQQNYLYRDQTNNNNLNEKKLIHISSDESSDEEEDSDSDNDSHISDSHISESSMTSDTTSDETSDYSNDDQSDNNEDEPARILLQSNKIYIGGFQDDDRDVIELKENYISDDDNMSSSDVDSDYDSGAQSPQPQVQDTVLETKDGPNPVLDLDQVHVIKIDQESHPSSNNSNNSNNSNKKNIHIVNLEDDDESHKPHPQEDEHAPSHNLANLQSYTAVSVGELRQYIKEHLSPEKLEELGIAELNKIKKAQLVKIVQDMKSA